MKRQVQYIITAAVVLCFAAGCTLLPLAIFGVQDQELVGRVHTETVEETVSPIRHTMSIVEKLKFYAKSNTYLHDGSEHISAIPLEQGARLNQETVWTVCQEELSRLAALGLAPERQREMLTNEKRFANSFFYIDTDDPTQNMIAWNLEFADNEGGVLVHLDDETGKILKYMYRFSNDALWKEGLDVVAEKWAEYLGVDYRGVREEGESSSAASITLPYNYKAYDDTEDEFEQKVIERAESENRILARYAIDGTEVSYPLVKYQNGYSFGDFGFMYGTAVSAAVGVDADN